MDEALSKERPGQSVVNEERHYFWNGNLLFTFMGNFSELI